MIVRLLILVSVIGLTACSAVTPYQPDIQQGNVMTTKQLSQLRLGMTATEVKKIMGGAPVLRNPFTADTMNYVYTFRPGKGKRDEKSVILSFQSGKLSQIATSANVASAISAQ